MTQLAQTIEDAPLWALVTTALGAGLALLASGTLLGLSIAAQYGAGPLT